MKSENSRRNRSSSERWSTAIQLLTVAFAVLVLCIPAFSQGNAGRILGTVTDQSGGTVAGATVTVIDVDRGVNRTLTTDDAGEYNAPNLIPGNYTVRAEAKGFKKLERQNVVIEVGKELRVDLTLQPGGQEQTVTVTEAVPLVDTTTATLGGTLENSEIVDLPLNGRDYQSLLGLRPGVMLQVGGGPWTQSTNGVRPDQSVWLIDGVINSNFFDARPLAGMPSPITDGATILPIDSIQEFNLMENPKAEYGWKPGAVVNVGIKSGTNAFHGTAYGFYRSSNWDARNYFNFESVNGTCSVGPLAACDKPPAQLKQYGASVGGPIMKDKLFFFANFEGLNDLIGNAFGTTGGTGVPETGVTNGDTTNNMAAAINCLAFPSAATCGTGAPAAAIPISPISLGLAGCTVGATAAATTCSGGFFPSNPTNGTGFLSTIPNVNNSYNGVSKIDYHVNDKNTVNGDFIIGRYKGDGEDRGFINKIFNNNYIINTWTVSGNWDYTPSSSIVNEVRIGYNQMAFITGSDDATLKNPLDTGATEPGFPTISVGSFGLFGTWHNRPQAISPNPYWDVIDDLSYLKGKHALKFGGEYAHIEADSNIPDYARGRINFGGGTSFSIPIACPGGATPPCTNDSTGLEDFFAGDPSGGQFFVGNANRKMLWTNLAGFVQDDWRISPKFTLNVGMRYEYRSPIRDSQNLWANFDPNSPTGLVQQGQPGHNTLWNPDRGDFSPRVGFAWDLNGKGTTVVRGGFSIIYETFTAVEWMNQNQFQNNSSVSLAANPSGACTVSVPTGETCAQAGGATLGGDIIVKAAKFKPGQMCYDPAVPTSACAGQSTVFPSGGAISCTAGSPCNLMGVDPNLKTPYVENFSLGVTHAFTNDLSLEVGYVGNHGARLTGFSDINQCLPYDTLNEAGLPKAQAPTCVQPYASKFPYFNFINYMTNSVRSNYHSLQATLTKRMSHGVSFVAGYTFAHGLDNGSLNRFGLLPQNASDPGAEYGNSDFDVRHRLTLTGTYNIPGIKGFGQVLEGWQINAIATIQSSQPWDVNDYNNNFSGSGDAADRWDFFGNPSDFKGTANSIPYCSGFGVTATGGIDTTGASCTITNGVSNVTSTPSDSSTLISNCAAKAPDAHTLKKGGCFAEAGSVMTPPISGTFGTMGRNIFRDSGFKNLDFSVFKTFTWKERYSAQFRAEIFNILNHPIPENPYGASNGSSGGNNDPSSPSGFGGAIGTPDVVAGNPLVGSGDARDIQIGLKLTF
jgi:hypothetical protein